MSESKHKKKLLLRKKLADDIESSKLIQEYNIKHAKNGVKKLAASKLLKPTQQSQSQSSYPKKDDIPTIEDNDTVPFIEESIIAEVSGPQLRVNKSNLIFFEKTGHVNRDHIILTNNGTTAIYYKWKRIEPSTFFTSTLLDKEERFFSHAVSFLFLSQMSKNKNVIKPGESRPFYFTFKSRSTGIFEEEWILECEPSLLSPLPVIKLCGHALEDDNNIEWRSEVDTILENSHKNRFVREILDDVVGRVRTPTPPRPNLDDPQICKQEFEAQNEKYHLYFTPLIINLYRNLQDMIYEELKISKNDPESYWNLNIDFLKDKIQQVKDDFMHGCLTRRFWDLFKLAKKKPQDRSTLFKKCKKLLEQAVLDFDEFSNTIRREKDFVDYHFYDPSSLTEDELKKKRDEENKAKAELLKKIKKKPRSEEDEKKAFEEYKKELSSRMSQKIIEKLAFMEKNETYIRSIEEIQTRPQPNKLFFEKLALKKTIKDLDMNIEGRRMMLRVHLKKKPQQLFQAQWDAYLLQVEEENKRQEELAKLDKKKEFKKPIKKTKEEIAEEIRKQKEEEERKRFIMGLDEENLVSILKLVKYCLEQLAKLVIVYVTYGSAEGRPINSNSVRFFWEYMKTNLEQICNFEESCKIVDILEKHEMELYPDNSCLILENAFNESAELGFIKDENGNIEKLDDQVMYDYGQLLNDYAPCYILEDTENFFKGLTSVTKIRPIEIGAFGPSISNDIQLIAQSILHSAYEPKPVSKRKRKEEIQILPRRKPSLALIGGEFSGDHVIALDTLLYFYDKIYLGGNIGLYFFMFTHKLERVADIVLDELKKTSIEIILQHAKEINKQICFPNKFIIALKQPQINPDGTIIESRKFWPPEVPEEKGEVKEEVKEEPKMIGKKDDKKEPKKDKKEEKKEAMGSNQALKKQMTPDIPLIEPSSNDLDSNYYIVAYETNYIDEILNLIEESRNVLWIGSFNVLNQPENSELNRTIAFSLYQKSHTYKKNAVSGNIDLDWTVSCVGESVIDAMNSLDVVIDTQASKRGEDDTSQNENKSQTLSKADIDEGEAPSSSGKKNTVNIANYICDSLSTNLDFCLKILAGQYVECFETITEFDMKKEGEDEEEFSFLDEIQNLNPQIIQSSARVNIFYSQFFQL